MPHTVATRLEPGPAEQFFGLAARPFSLTPDLRFAFPSRSHREALAQVTTALHRREGLIVVTGDIGTGKTMLCRSMLETFEARTFLSVILDPRLDAEDLLRQVLTDFGILERPGGPGAIAQKPSATRHQMVTALQQFLGSLIPLQAHAVIMIDEAQHLSPAVLEEVRLLSNFETDSAKLLQIVLVGQPDLEHVLRRPDMRQLNQRVARHCMLYPLSQAEVAEYIERRITVAASPDALEGRQDAAPSASAAVQFSVPAVRTVADLSGGIPRLVNTICDRALEVAFERRTRAVDVDEVMAGAGRLHLDSSGIGRAAQRPPVPPPVGDADDLYSPRTERFRLAQQTQSGAIDSGNTPEADREIHPSGSTRRGVGRQVAAAAAVILVAGSAAWWWNARSRSATPSPVPTSRPAAVQSSDETGRSSAPSATSPSVTPASAASTAVRTAGAAVPPSQGGFIIAVASFRTEQRAREVATALGDLRLPASVELDGSGMWYRVLAGPFSTREAADDAQSVLTKNGYTDTRVSPVAPAAR